MVVDTGCTAEKGLKNSMSTLQRREEITFTVYQSIQSKDIISNVNFGGLLLIMKSITVVNNMSLLNQIDTFCLQLL